MIFVLNLFQIYSHTHHNVVYHDRDVCNNIVLGVSTSLCISGQIIMKYENIMYIYVHATLRNSHQFGIINGVKCQRNRCGANQVFCDKKKKKNCIRHREVFFSNTLYILVYYKQTKKKSISLFTLFFCRLAKVYYKKPGFRTSSAELIPQIRNIV